MISADKLLVIVLWLSIAVVCLDLMFVFVVLVRRAVGHHYYRRKDAAKARFAPTLHYLLAKEMSPNQAIEKLGPVRGAAERDALRDLLLAAITPATRERVTEFLVRMGYVDKWIRTAFGRGRGSRLARYVFDEAPMPQPNPWRTRLGLIHNLRVFAIPRAEAVQSLGRLTPELAEFFIEEAKQDPSPEVRRMNIAAMGQTGSALAYLLPELENAVNESNGIAVRTIKAAIVRAQIEDPEALVSFLDHHNDRVRFLVVDCIREICSKVRETPLAAHNFPQQMYRLFLEVLVNDECVDVRARSAAVVRHFHDTASTAALLALMRDDNEFVRLHAVRACADAYYAKLIPEIAERLTDSRWRVREAAVKTLNHLGTRGMRAIAETFLSTNDRYAGEQIAEELQRSGAIVEIVEGLDAGSEPSRIATAVCRKMISLGKSSFLAEMLGKHHSLEKRTRLMDLLATSRTPYTEAVLQWIATRPNDPLARLAAQRLQARDSFAVAAEAGGQN